LNQFWNPVKTTHYNKAYALAWMQNMLLTIYWVLVSNKILFLYNKYAQTITQWIHFFSFEKNHSLK
jgi:hypothetical protein